MRKLKCNCRWNQLSPKQRETLENWLFQDHLGYEETLVRVKNEFGLKASRTSLCRYYKRRSHERQTVDLIEAQAMVETVAAPESNTDAMRTAAVKLIAKTALKIAFERPDRLKELESLTKLLLMNEDIEIRRSRVKLEQEQFHYQAASAASEELPKLAGLLLKIDEDDDLDEAEKTEKVHDLLYPDKARQGLHEFEEDEDVEEEDEPEEDEEADEEEAEEAEEPAPAASQTTSEAERPSDQSDGSDGLDGSHTVTEEAKPPPEEDAETKELKRLTAMAEKGDPFSAYCLGARYRDGFKVPKDLKKAREWLGKAASGGVAGAKIELHSLLMRHGDLD